MIQKGGCALGCIPLVLSKCVPLALSRKGNAEEMRSKLIRVNAICTSKCLFTDQNLLRIYSEFTFSNCAKHTNSTEKVSGKQG